MRRVLDALDIALTVGFFLLVALLVFAAAPFAYVTIGTVAGAFAYLYERTAVRSR
jgi:hypothetical protein